MTFFITPPPTPPKLISINTESQESINKFQDELMSLNILNKLNSNLSADPNDNYNIKFNINESSKNKHLPSKIVKFDKHKKKKKSKWITNELVKSISCRDSLYKKLKMTDPDSPDYALKDSHFKIYSGLIQTCIRILKRKYYRACFLKFKGDIRKTW